MTVFGDRLRGWSQNALRVADQAIRLTIIKMGDDLVRESPVGNPSMWEKWSYTKIAGVGRVPVVGSLTYGRKGPKGYAGGRFKGNWQLGLEAAPTGTLDIRDPSGAASMNRIRAGVPIKAYGHVYYIVNNLPYARKLEYGHSRQAPNGMVRITAAKFRGTFLKIMREAKKIK